MPRADRYAGSNRQAAAGSPDRKLPSRPVTTCQEVVPVRPLTVIVTLSAGRKSAPHTVPATAIGGAAIGCMQKKTRAWPACGTIGCGGNGPGQPTGFDLIGLAVIGGQRFGASDGGTTGCPVGAASGCGVVTMDCGVVAATADWLGLEVAAERTLVGDDDVHAAVKRPASKIALRVACFIKFIKV